MKKQFWIKNNQIFENSIDNFDERFDIEFESFSKEKHFISHQHYTKTGGRIFQRAYVRKDFEDSSFRNTSNQIRIEGFKFDDVVFIVRVWVKNSSITFHIYKSGEYEFVRIDNSENLTFFEKIKTWFKF